MKKNKREHLGIELKMPVYSIRRNLTERDLNKFVDAYVELVERFGWFTYGGAELIDMNKKR